MKKKEKTMTQPKLGSAKIHRGHQKAKMKEEEKKKKKIMQLGKGRKDSLAGAAAPPKGPGAQEPHGGGRQGPWGPWALWSPNGMGTVRYPVPEQPGHPHLLEAPSQLSLRDSYASARRGGLPWRSIGQHRKTLLSNN